MKPLNTFDNHPKAKYWSDKNKISPNEVGINSTRKFYFNCDKCHHTFEKTIQTITKMNTWCPYCSNHKLCSENNCTMCKEKSFIMNPKSQYWSNKNKLTPREVFRRCSTKFIFNCNKCNNEFSISPDKIYMSRWCRNCRDIILSERFRMTLEEFINKANIVHNGIYDYSKVNYTRNSNHVIIICKIHGEFSQTPQNHLAGYNCIKCANINSSNKRKYTNIEFIEKANIIHNFKYDYLKVNYINSASQVIIICKKHGEFNQSPNTHLQGIGCNYCGRESTSEKLKLTKEEFIEKAKKIHGDLYDYSKTIYNGRGNIITIICKIHGEFIQNPSVHLNNSGCKKCSPIAYSNISINWLNFMSIYYNINIEHKLNKGEYKINNTKYSVDGYSKENNCVWEFYGDYWHGNPKKYDLTKINSHLNKTFKELYDKTMERKQNIINLGYNYKDIWESDWIKAIKLVRIIQKSWRKKHLKEN